MKYLRPYAPQVRLVGRSDQISAIQDALTDTTGRTHLLYIIGPGGIGKTRLLEEAARLLSAATVRHNGIIDLYHSKYHSADGIEETITTSLDPNQEYFLDYRERRSTFEKRRATGMPPEVLQKEQEALTLAFIQDYNQMTRSQRSLLCFDTMELIQYESDPVQQICQLVQEVSEVRNWLARVLPKLDNSVILLASRECAPLRDELEKICGSQAGLRFRVITLSGLSKEETIEYFDALTALDTPFRDPRLSQIPVDVRERIWKYTGGHPVRLSLVIDLILNGRSIADLFPPRTGEIPSADRDKIDERLVTELMGLPALERTMLLYLALARKGLNTDILQHLASGTWDRGQCRKNLARMRNFTFVKTRSGTDLIFMHDELYSIFDRFVLRDHMEFLPTLQSLARYYSARLELLRRKIENEAVVRRGSRMLSQYLQELRVLKPELLYYQLQVDPAQGFWRFYVPWAEGAVRAADSSLDMELRDELLRFLSQTKEDDWVTNRLPHDVVDRDAAARWVRRFLGRGDHQKSAKIARQILETDEAPLGSQDPLYRAAVQTAYAEALLYKGAVEADVSSELTQAIKALEGWQPKSADDPRSLWRHRILGRAHNNLGYLHCQIGRNAAATAEFQQAIWYFRKDDIQDEVADTCTNQGFVYARWGRATEAETALQDAKGIRERWGLEFPLGLTINTLGLAYVYTGKPLTGLRWSQKALDIFERLEHSRGQGLAHLALAWGLRMRGEMWKAGTYTPGTAVGYYTKALEHLERAEEIFKNIATEPLRLWEVYSERGSVYCDWGWLLQEQGHPNAVAEKYDLAATCQKQAAKIAGKHKWKWQAVDSYDDLSQIYADWGSHDSEVQKWLEMVRKNIPPGYALTKKGFGEPPKLPEEGWWLALGKLELGYGVRWIKQAVDNRVAFNNTAKDAALCEATEHYARAIAYFQKYSPNAPDLETTLKSIHRRLRTVSTERLKKVRQQFVEFAEQHGLDFRRLLELLDATLGREPQPDEASPSRE